MYNWNKKILINRYDTLNKLKENTTNGKKLEKILNDMELLESYLCDKKEFFKQEKLINTYNMTKENLLKKQFLFEDINTFNKNITYLEVENLKDYPIKTNDLFTIMHDFYYQLDSLLYKHFYKLYQVRETHFRTQKNMPFSGQCLYLSYFDECFIEILKTNTIEDILTVLHEYMHAISININNYNNLDNKNLYCEIEPLFIELIAIDYLKRYFDNDMLDLAKIHKHNNHEVWFDMSNLIIELIMYEINNKIVINNNRMLKEIAFNNFMIEKNMLQYIINEVSENTEVEMVGYMFAIELYSLYQIDPEKALYLLKKIILLREENDYDYYQAIINMGIIPNENINKYTTQCTEICQTLKKFDKFCK